MSLWQPVLGAGLLTLLLSAVALAHGVQGKDASFIEGVSGVQIVPFMYLGAKHMVTGYDHLLFILGVIFFMQRLVHVAVYVTLFSIGHSLTLLAGVLGGLHVNPYIVDAIVGLSVAYKAFDNLGGFTRVLGFQPNLKAVVFGFGLVHGFGLATKLQELQLSEDGLLANMLAFNVGVELGQLAALSLMLLVMHFWRVSRQFEWQATIANGLLLCAGIMLTQYQIIGYYLSGSH
jgi:hypothetical protein